MASRAPLLHPMKMLCKVFVELRIGLQQAVKCLDVRQFSLFAPAAQQPDLQSPGQQVKPLHAGVQGAGQVRPCLVAPRADRIQPGAGRGVAAGLQLVPDRAHLFEQGCQVRRPDLPQ